MKRLKVLEGEFESCIVFKVESRSTPDAYHTVDISSHQGYGQCSCKNWECNVWPVVRDKTARRLTKAARCSHLEAVYGYLLGKMIKSLIDQFAPHQSYDET